MPTNQPQRLHDIATKWTQVQIALFGQGPEAARAQAELFDRYGGAMRRYVQAILHDPAAADDMLQEFALAMVSGGFQAVRPERGRFRDYIKGVLFRMVRKHRRNLSRREGTLPEEVDLADPDSYPAACDEEFRQSWRDELLARTWERLVHDEASYFTILHFRAVHPDMTSDKMVAELSPQLGKPLTAQGVRQTLRRARKRFVELLMEEVAGSLELPSPGAIHDELRDLDLAAFILPPRPRSCSS